MLTNIRHRLERLGALDEDPRRTAAALAFGVFLSFSPFLGLQVFIGLIAAFWLRLSRIALLVGLCANLPWFMLPWYALTTAMAAAALGTSADVDISSLIGELLALPVYQPAFWGRTGEMLKTFFWPFVIGPTIGAACLAAIAYVGGLRLLTAKPAVPPPAETIASEPLAGDAEQRAADRHVHDAQGARLQP